MMRKEELVAREAWALEDAILKHAIELWEHEARISFLRLNHPPGAPASCEAEGRAKLPPAPRANRREKKHSPKKEFTRVPVPHMLAAVRESFSHG